MRLPKFDYNKLLYDGAGDEDDSKPSANRVIAVHGGLMERPMGTKKAKAPSVLDIPKIKKNDSTETSEGSVGTDSTSVNLDSVF